MDPNKDWADVRPMRDVINGSDSIRLRRFVLILLGSFAGLAVLLAAVGTYGVMAYSVADRTREIGIRVALGATRSMVLNQVLSETMKLTLAGLVIGGLAAQVLTRFISSMLFGVSSTDAVTYLGRVARARRRRAARQLSPCATRHSDRSSRGAAAGVNPCRLRSPDSVLVFGLVVFSPVRPNYPNP